MADKDREAWLEARRQGLGGSDSPIVLGVSPWRTPADLWAEKRGLVPLDQEPTPAMKRGKVLEHIVADMYAEATGRKVRVVREQLKHPGYPWMLGNIDREIIDPVKGPGVLEIKCPGLRRYNECQREGVPEDIQVQLQHYLEVSDRKWGAFAVFSAEKWELIYFDVDKDRELINFVIVKGAEFWQMVLDGVEPQALEKTTKLNLPKIGGDLVQVDTDEWIVAANRLREAKSLREEAELLEADAKVAIQEIMEAEKILVAEGGDMRVYWKWQDGRRTIDTKRLIKEKPGIYQEYLKIGDPFRTFRSFDLKPKIYD